MKYLLTLQSTGNSVNDLIAEVTAAAQEQIQTKGLKVIQFATHTVKFGETRTYTKGSVTHTDDYAYTLSAIVERS